MLNRFNVSSCTLNLYVGNPTLMETMLCQSVLGLPIWCNNCSSSILYIVYHVTCQVLWECNNHIHANKVGCLCRIHACSVEPYLQYVQYCCTVWNPYLKRDIEAAEKLQQHNGSAVAKISILIVLMAMPSTTHVGTHWRLDTKSKFADSSCYKPSRKGKEFMQWKLILK